MRNAFTAKTGLLLLLVALIGLTAVVIYFWHDGLSLRLLLHLREILADSEALRQRLLDYGPLAPLLFIGIQVLQVLFAPIPGEASGFVGGYVFGIWGGFLYSTVGLTIGSALAFGIGRLLDEALLRRLHGSTIYFRFNKLIHKNTFVIPFLLFIIPGFPKDALSYLLGLSLMPWPVFLFIAAIGRMPGTLMLSLQGAQVYEQNFLSFLLLLLVSAAVALPCYFYRQRILKWLSRLRRRPPRPPAAEGCDKPLEGDHGR